MQKGRYAIDTVSTATHPNTPATKSLNELKERFKDAPTSQNAYEIDGIRYVVVSHYTGKKDIDKVITELAEQRAYTEFGFSRS